VLIDKPGVIAAGRELGVVKHSDQEFAICSDAGCEKILQAAQQFSSRGFAIRPVGNELREQRIIMNPDVSPAIDAGVDS
jgi:hypothetical protein